MMISPSPLLICVITVILGVPQLLTGQVSAEQQAKLDSLLSVWQDGAEADSNRINAFQKYIWDGFLFSDTDSAYALTREFEEFAEREDNDLARLNVLNLYGCFHFMKGEYDEALEFFEDKLVYDEKLGLKTAKARTYGNIGLVYQFTGDIPGALRQFKLSYAIKEEANDRQGMAISATNIGLIYLDKGMPAKAISFLQESRRIEEELGDKRGLAGTYINIGNVHLRLDNDDEAIAYYKRAIELCDELGELEFKANALNGLGTITRGRDQFEESLKYYQQALEARLQLGDRKGLASSYTSLGDIYRDMGDDQRALSNYEESLRIREEMNYPFGIALSHVRIGDYYRHTGNYRRALTDCYKGERIAREIGAYKVQKDGCHCLYDSYKVLAQPDSALKYHELKMQLVDSIDENESSRKIQEMEFREQILADSLQQEEEKLKMQIAFDQEVYKKTRSKNIALGSGLLFLLLAGGLFSRNRYISRSRRIIEKEKDRSEKLLLNILPYEIAEELKEKGEAGARDFDMVSILFTDFMDFTQKSSELSATDLVAEIDTCFKAFDRIVDKYGIEKIKTIGDAYMAAGGIPVPSEDAASRTVEAAIAMQRFMLKHNRERLREGKFAFEMRVGIHSGPVVAGIVGVKKFQYDIWGDTVNTASRMETNGSSGKINISQSTYDLISEDPKFTFEPRGMINVKGKGEVRMYYVDLS